MGDENVYDALTQWLSTFCQTPAEKASLEDPTDGLAMAFALHRIDQNHFNDEWLAKVRTDVPRANKRLKVNNLKKVQNGIHDYNVDVLAVQFPGFRMPDLTLAADGNKQELGGH